MTSFGASLPRSLDARVLHHSIGKEAKMAKKTFKVGRSAKTGRFTTVKRATERKSTHVVETIKKPK